MAVPKNIKLSLLINRRPGGMHRVLHRPGGGGQRCSSGLEMLPIPRAPLGFDRFPADNDMQAVDADGKPVPGELAKPVNVWFAPDRFVLAIWNGASGRSLGGAAAWASVHPDLSVESYGYRNQVDGPMRCVPADLFPGAGRLDQCRPQAQG